MIECAFGKKFPELISCLEGNLWIDSFSTESMQLRWRSTKNGEFLDMKPDASKLKNPRKSVMLPTHPFVYSSKSATWSNCTFENGDEDYFDEITLGPVGKNNANNVNVYNFLLMEIDISLIRKVQYSKVTSFPAHKAIRRNSGSIISTSLIGSNSPMKEVIGDSYANNLSNLTMFTSALSSDQIQESALSMAAETNENTQDRDGRKSKHHSQLGQLFVKSRLSSSSSLLKNNLSSSIENRKLRNSGTINTVVTDLQPPDTNVPSLSPSKVNSKLCTDFNASTTSTTSVEIFPKEEFNITNIPTDEVNDNLCNPDSVEISESSEPVVNYKSTDKISGGFPSLLGEKISRPEIPLSDASGLSTAQRNKEFFKRVKEQEDEVKRRLEDESNPEALKIIKENEIQSKEHDKSKTAHYAKLGATFAIKDNMLTKGAKKTPSNRT